MFASKQFSAASLFFTLLLVLPKIQAQGGAPNILSQLGGLSPDQLYQVIQGVVRPQVIGAQQATSFDEAQLEKLQSSGGEYKPAGFGRGGTVWTRQQAASDFLQKPSPAEDFKGKDIPTRPSNNADSQTQLDHVLKVIGLINDLLATISGVSAGSDMTLTTPEDGAEAAGQGNNLRVRMTPGGNWRASN
ncbi:hypothetical protein HBI37_042310 [Parastagonospora nodorum]|nr:hypothetical protein HBH42_106320 [Parastagonospora nodorum]KAH5386610.1 hypothetical protein HBI33_067490 [Parastagonospora nodorum]KAH5606664.1 hypothetical protein HBI45_100310 [Parastagonospora nodorum]KAH6352005.1 hypothetical protein HBI37_042310 [Parastagonospora nodorum]KAH6355979.1 hypothetical protein HBI36_087530 [Parastagonospora nodorum]